MVLNIINRFLVTEDFFEFNLKFLFYVGLRPNEDFSARQLELYKLYEIITHLSTIIFFIIAGIGTTQCTDNVIVFLSQIDKLIVLVKYLLKILSFFIRREKFWYLINDIISSGDKVTEKNRDNMIKLVVGLSGFITFMMVLFSIVEFSQNEMTVKAWMPFDPYKNKMNLAISAQILAILATVPILYRAVGIQGLICSILIYLCDQLEDLQKRLRNLKYTKENEKMAREELTKVVMKHIRLMGYSNSMESMLKGYFLVQNFAVTLELCINAVLVAIVTWDQVSVISGFLAYLGVALINSYVYCHLGNNLVEQSEEIAQAAFDADWTCWPVDMQKTILLIITVAQRPLKMSAGGVAIIDIKNYGSALYNGYKIFAVLNDVLN